jgi:alpha-2-macroglobulin-like protein
MKRLTLAAVLATTALTARADSSGTIDGTVVASAGLAGVHLSITCGSVHRSVSIDGSGHFTITGLPEGSCTLVGSGSGFQTINMSIAVSASSIATVLVSMAPPAPPMPPMAAEPMPAPVARGMAEHHAAAAPRMPPPPPPPPPPKQDAKRPRPAMHARARLEMAGGELVAQQVAEYAPVRVFPVPQYTRPYDGPREDFRETIYWNGGVETDAAGDADVTFVASDAVTAFRATAEGLSTTGAPGGGQLAIQSKLPLNLDAHLPVEVTAGDEIELPITLTNSSDAPIDAQLTAKFGTAFQLVTNPINGPIHLAAGAKRSVMFPLRVGASGSAEVELVASTQGLEDKLMKTVRVVPLGFPFEVSAAGTAKKDRVARHDFELAGALPGSMRATVTMYPSPLATMTKGMDGMIREPGGCFEQASSSNYPNIMILGYLGSTNNPDPTLVEKTQGVLDHGYQLLTGYETPEKGYEWFGKTPGHEALTAYGLMEFADMAKVYDVDHKMVERTAAWLMSRRDHAGGFLRSSEALDSFGSAGAATTNAYIMWALASAGRTTGLDQELAAQSALARTTSDPYLLSLATGTLVTTQSKDGPAAERRLVALQAKDGSFPGAKESITKSGGESLVIEATSLALLALLRAPDGLEAQIRLAADYLDAHRSGYGGWSNTQATILGLKALTAYAEHGKQMQASGSATLIVNGKPAGTIAFDKGRREALVWDDLAPLLAAGHNSVVVQLDGEAQLPYSIAIEYRAVRPQSSERAQVAITTELASAHVKPGEGVTMRAHVENRTKAGIPMTLARIGIPGGTVFQTWQLKELRDKGVIDFYETRPREVIVYWRAMAPSAKHDVELDLLAAVPGTYEAPASSAYLYYTAEDKAWTPPVKLTIEP